MQVGFKVSNFDQIAGGNMPKHGAHTTLPASPTTLGNHNLDNLKCFECGKNGHFQNQCPNNKLFPPTQAFVVLSTGATTNLEDGNTPKFEASTSLPTPLSNRYRDNVKCFQCGKNGHYHNRCPEGKSDNVKCFECGKGGHYQNQCSERKSDDVKCFECGKSGHYKRQCPKRKRSSPVQAYETLLTVATTNLEGNQRTTPGNQTTTPENQTTTPEDQTTAPECQTGIIDQQKSIETPYCSTQDTCGKSVSILDKSTFEDKHYEELRREDYHHGNKGCDQEQVQAWGHIQSSPFGLTNIASSFDQSPKTDTPQLPVVVTSENNKGSGDTPYIATKTSVWWDIENCPVPRGNSDTYYLAQNISSALADAGYKGAVTISAYGDTHKIPNAVQQALSSTGIALNHVPAGVKDASDKKILVDMLFWAVDNPPPANYLLISGDRDFSNALHQLRLRRYNILLAHAPPVSQALVAAAKKVWQWASLLSGGPPLQDLELGTKTSSANKSSFNVIKGPIPKRLKWKGQNARGTQKTFSESQSKEGCDIQSENHASFPRVSQPETSEITRLKCAPISSPSREIVCGKRPRDLVDSSEQMPFKSMFNLDNEKNSFNSQPFKLCRLFAPSNSAPSQNNNYYSSITQPNHQHIMLGPPHLQLMQNKSEIIQHPTNHHQNIKPSQIYNDNQNNGYQVHSSEAHRHIGHIVSALTKLKTNKIAPTDENISNCIHYGMGKRSFNVKVALDYACENNMLTRYNLDNGALFYLGKNEQFWECVNVLDITDKHSEETWNAIQNFLSSASGQSAISSTECRYHAATELKKACLQHLALGEVLQLLNTVIKFRKWIVPNPSGWQPLSFTLKVVP